MADCNKYFLPYLYEYGSHYEDVSKDSASAFCKEAP